MTPVLVRDFRELSKYFESYGLSLIPRVMRERFQGKIYPCAYSEEEKFLIREYLAKARENNASVIAEMGETPTINMFADDRLLDPPTIYRGKLCGSGHSFVSILPDGAVVRCGSGMQLGNILQKHVAFLKEPTPCDTFYCPYFCAKYTSPPYVSPQETKRDLGDFFMTVKAWRDCQRAQADK